MKKAKRWYSPRVHSNLMRAYERANETDRTEGIRWYERAHEACAGYASKYGVTLEAACGIVAALSPGRAWEANLADAETFLDEWSNGARGKQLPLVGSYGWRNIVKASKIASGLDPLAVLGGDKVRAFYACILDPSNASDVCIDRHAKSAALGEKLSDRPTKERIGRFNASASVRKSEYRVLSRHYVRAAQQVGVLPHQFQAIVWVVWRRLAGNLTPEVPF